MTLDTMSDSPFGSQANKAIHLFTEFSKNVKFCRDLLQTRGNITIKYSKIAIFTKKCLAGGDGQCATACHTFPFKNVNFKFSYFFQLIYSRTPSVEKFHRILIGS